MKKIILICLFLFSGTAFAHNRGHGHGNGWSWVAPTIVGGVIGYELARQRRETQTVIVQQPPSIPVYSQCGPWIEIQNSDGSVTRTRTCN